MMFIFSVTLFANRDHQIQNQSFGSGTSHRQKRKVELPFMVRFLYLAVSLSVARVEEGLHTRLADGNTRHGKA